MKKLLLINALLLGSLNVLALDFQSPYQTPEQLTNMINGLRSDKGDPVKGESQKYGFGFQFDEDSSFNIWGLTRLYAYPDSKSNKIMMPYFRTYVDAQKGEVMFRARFDYRFAMMHQLDGTTEEGTGATNSPMQDDRGIWVARAYFTYSPKELKNWSFDIGRLLHQPNKYDVLTNPHAMDSPTLKRHTSFGSLAWKIGNKIKPDGTDEEKMTKGIAVLYTSDANYSTMESIIAKYNDGPLNMKYGVSYGRDADPASKEHTTERFLYSAYVGYENDFKEFGGIAYGVGASAVSHNEASANYLEILPDFLYKKGNFWILDQGMVRKVYDGNGFMSVDDYHMLFRNYLEIGYDFGFDHGLLNSYFYLDSAHYGDLQLHDLAFEAYYYMEGQKHVGMSITYKNIFNTYDDDSRDSNFWHRFENIVFVVGKMF